MKTKSALQTKAVALLRLDSCRKAHHRALSSLHASPLQAGETHEQRGLAMWRRLRRIETIAHDAATAQCNGERYQSQPYREDEAWEEFQAGILAQVCHVFGVSHMHPPAGLFINHDPRGYALKLDSEKTVIPHGLETDWGGYGLLAAEITL